MSEKELRMTKKMGKEFFQKVFGSCPSNMRHVEPYRENGGICYAEYGTMTAECYMDRTGHLVLTLSMETIHTGCIMFYDPKTYEIDFEYTIAKQRENERLNAFEYMDAHNFVVKPKGKKNGISEMV